MSQSVDNISSKPFTRREKQLVKLGMQGRAKITAGISKEQTEKSIFPFSIWENILGSSEQQAENIPPTQL